MSTNIKPGNRRLLEAVEYIDEGMILDALSVLRLPKEECAEPIQTWKTPFKHWKQFTALAACMVLLAFSAPIFSYFSRVIGDWGAGAESGICEETTGNNSISQTELDAINTAWTNQWLYYTSYCNSPDEIQYLQGPNCFYGKYNGCIVLMRQTPFDFYEEQIVNDLIFKCPGLHLWVCIDSTYYSLYSAYAEGFLTDEQISEIWELHNKNKG